jgi:hypothetical protein
MGHKFDWILYMSDVWLREDNEKKKNKKRKTRV